MRLARRFAALCALAAPLLALAQAPEAADPDRALEDLSRPETQAFLRDQDAAGRTLLASLPGEAALAARIRELSQGRATVSALRLEAGKVFYLRRRGDEPGPSLCMRDGLAGAERVLVDARKLDAASGIVEAFVPSPDARHVAYSVVSASGDTTLHVLAVDGAREVGEPIARARAVHDLAWHPDGRAFYYARSPEGSAGARRDAGIHVYRHALGRKAAQDEVVFAPGVGGARDVPEFVQPSLIVPLESAYAYAIARDGLRNEIAVHVTAQKDLASARPQWRKVISPEDGVTAIVAWKGDVFALTHRGAPRFRILRLDAANPSVAHGRVAVPEGDSAIQAMALARDALYLRTTVGGLDRLERLPLGILGSHSPQYVKTPFESGIAQLVTHPRRPGALLRLEGWIEPPSIVEVDAKTGNLHDTKLQPPARADFSAMDEVRLYAPAEDGTKIPVTLLYRKTTQLDGNNPTIVTAFGAYGRSVRPDFDPARLAWLERGGVYAIAHVRGGGEYGERWHAQGMRAAKATTITDFIAVADFLVKYGFTNPKRLAIEASGAGTLPIGGALVRRPDLFAAVVAHAPMFDMLRYEQSPAGPASVAEFGSASRPGDAETLAAISAYHRVAEATVYPGVLLEMGRDDPWQAAKMAARLQRASASGRPVLLVREAPLAEVYAFVLWQLGDPAFQPAKEEAKQ